MAREPVDDSGARPAAPGVDLDRDLYRPQPENGERREELIAPVIEKVEESRQPADLLGRRNVFRLERFDEPAKACRFKGVCLEAMEKLGEKHQVGGALFDVGENGSNPRFQQSREDPTRGKNDEKRRRTDVGEYPAGYRRGPEHA